MNILYVMHFLNGFLMLVMPIGLGIYLARRFQFGWRFWWIGAGTFLLAQVGHLPFNAVLTVMFERGLLPSPPENWHLAFNALVLGLSAALWEEVARYLAYRTWAKDARTWAQGLMLGAGHGGIEAIILGLLVLVNFVIMIMLQGMDLSSLIPSNQLGLIREQLGVYWSIGWYIPLLGALERFFAICFHLAASILVLQVFLRKQISWLWIAIGLHALLDAVAVFAMGTWGPYVAEALIAVLALLSLGIIFGLRPAHWDETPQTETLAMDPRTLQVLSQVALPDLAETPENLESTRFT